MYRTEETAATIPAGEYVARYRNAEKFIVFCQACSRYGACWACPPHGFDADEYLSGYRTALIIGTRIIPEPSARAECATECPGPLRAFPQMIFKALPLGNILVREAVGIEHERAPVV